MVEEGLDVDQFRVLNDHKINYLPPQKRTRVPRINGPFLRGPVPLVWLQEAMMLGIGALSVGITLRHFQGMKNSSTFKVGIQNLANYIGRSRVTCQRALQALEEGGLIFVERNNGRKHIVTILEVGGRNGREAPLRQ